METYAKRRKIGAAASICLGCFLCLGLSESLGFAWGCLVRGLGLLGAAWGWSASVVCLPPWLSGLPGVFWLHSGCLGLSELRNLGSGLSGAGFGAWAASLLRGAV